ncbi:MAG: glycine zipper 2TM domain-containing protein [Betaproteobacteria bacterium]
MTPSRVLVPSYLDSSQAIPVTQSAPKRGSPCLSILRLGPLLTGVLVGSAAAQTVVVPDSSPGVMPGGLLAPSVGVAIGSVPMSPAAPPAPVASPAVPAPVVPTPAPSLVTARVLSVTSVAQAAPASRVVCTEAAEVPAPTSGAGALAGALVGAALGSQVGGGSGQALATAAGVVGGALVGDKAEQGGRTQTLRNCVTHSGPAPVMAFQVAYEWAGQAYTTVLPYHPGASVQLQLKPVASAAAPADPALAVAGMAPPLAGTVVTHTVVMTAAPYAYGPYVTYGTYGPYGPYGRYVPYSPYWRAPVVVGVGAVWGLSHRGWHGHRRW